MILTGNDVITHIMTSQQPRHCVMPWIPTILREKLVLAEDQLVKGPPSISILHCPPSLKPVMSP